MINFPPIKADRAPLFPEPAMKTGPHRTRCRIVGEPRQGAAFRMGMFHPGRNGDPVPGIDGDSLHQALGQQTLPNWASASPWSASVSPWSAIG